MFVPGYEETNCLSCSSVLVAGTPGTFNHNMKCSECGMINVFQHSREPIAVLSPDLQADSVSIGIQCR